MDREKKLVTLSMVVLFFSLIVVYSLFYQVKGEEILGSLRSLKASSSVQEQEISSTQTLTQGNFSEGNQPERRQFHENRPQLEWDQFSDISVWIDAQQAEGEVKQTASTARTSIGDGPTILSGADLYFGAVDSIELLGLEPEYVLKDYKGFYYAKFEEEPYLKPTVQKLWWNIYTITSDAELVKNQLFGDKVSFINLPEYKNKIVVMLLTVNGQYWLIQMTYEKYHHAKSYLKDLFI